LTEEDNGAVIEVLLRRLYHFYGSHTGVLFGIDPSRRSAVEAIVKTIVEDIDSFRELCIENCEYITDSGMFSGVTQKSVPWRTIKRTIKEQD